LIKGGANCTLPAGQPIAGDTTYLTVVDKDGNMASWIQSIYSEFGSGVTVDGMGFLLHNRGAGFTLDAKSPNVLAGGKRPFHTSSPLTWIAATCISASASWRSESAAGARAVCLEHSRLQHEYSSRARSPALHEENLDGLRCFDRIASAASDPAATFRARPSDRHPERVYAGNGARPGHRA
jgi:hypothetical protein